MWIFTTGGFVSAVEHRDDARSLLVRARDRGSLDPVVAACGGAIESTPDADYPYRVTVTRDRFAEFLVNEVHNIDYPNFKEAAMRDQPEWSMFLHSVWGAGARYQGDLGESSGG